jgi:hypothetical protein
MTNHQRDEYVARDGIMNLLSDEEVARVSTAETAQKLADGDEYIDLEQLEQGVLRAQATPTPMGRVVPRKAVHEVLARALHRDPPAGGSRNWPTLICLMRFRNSRAENWVGA